MVYAIVFVAVIAGLIKKNNKFVFVCLLLLTWLLLGWSSGNADYTIHAGRYNGYEDFESYTEILYTALMQLGNRIGLTYEQFLPIVMLLYVLIVGYIVKSDACAPAFVIALYLIFPACMEAVQVRYTLAGGLVLLGLHFLLNEKSRLSEIKFCICILIAMLIHVSTLVFILFVVVKKFDYKKTILYTGIVSAILFISQSGFLIKLIALLPGMAEKISFVLDTASSRYTMTTILKTSFRIAVFFAAFMILSELLRQWMKKHKINSGCEYIECVQKLNIMSLAIIALIPYSVDFYRIQQTLSLINYCALSYFAVVLPEARSSGITSMGSRFVTTRKRLGFSAACVGASVINLYYLVLNNTNILTVFRPFFENNILFGGGYVKPQKNGKVNTEFPFRKSRRSCLFGRCSL